ncbi:unnamed protein product [Darwinula stevensoni]|uniref:Moesin/ezrin/radixin homolog 1 n=1 Tax=Darwinula stevensoni TaxID=69355 RepID=A0A7R8X6J3_9CRUS|nr:unnamed protein product [Darwinula stevensoni]CAG0881541.1 unnamed protein product [Darwinula stevensoni]
MLSRFGSKNEVNKGYRCMVRLLDENEEILECDFQGHHKGQHLLDQVCDKLNLLEKDFFGLRFIDDDKQRHWLDPTKNILKQVKSMNPIVFCFRVKFYPKDPHKLKEELTRYHLFLQLKRDLLHGRLYCSLGDAALLGAYIVQAEMGDYNPDEHGENPGYISEFKILLKQTPELEEQVAYLHQTEMRGQVPATAEAHFLRKACLLDTYGIDPHPVKDSRGCQLYLGVNHSGIMTYQASRKTHHFKWNDIQKLNYEGKMFIVHLTYNEKKHTVGFKCPSYAGCRHLWKCTVEQRIFFTYVGILYLELVESSSHAPKVVTGGSFFSRGSRLRYSGRTEKELLQHAASVNRDPPLVRRSASFHHRRLSIPAGGFSSGEESDGGYHRDGLPLNSPYSMIQRAMAPPSMEMSQSESSSRPPLERGSSFPDRPLTSVAESFESPPRRPAVPNPSIHVTGEMTSDEDIGLRMTAPKSSPGAVLGSKALVTLDKAALVTFNWKRSFRQSLLPALALALVCVAVGTVFILESNLEALQEVRSSAEFTILRDHYYLPLKSFLSRQLFEG